MRILIDIPISFSNITQTSLVIVFIGYVICFIALLSLQLIFERLPLIIHLDIKKLFKSKEKVSTAESNVPKDKTDITGEELAAISAALNLFMNDLHDEESRVVTIQKISRQYSPWSSKIYTVIGRLNKRF